MSPSVWWCELTLWVSLLCEIASGNCHFIVWCLRHNGTTHTTLNNPLGIKQQSSIIFIYHSNISDIFYFLILHTVFSNLTRKIFLSLKLFALRSIVLDLSIVYKKSNYKILIKCFLKISQSFDFRWNSP